MQWVTTKVTIPGATNFREAVILTIKQHYNDFPLGDITSHF